jgi:hypothetical protein
MVIALLAAGCAKEAARGDASGTPYTGEVWTWDENLYTVTLRRGTEDIRVRVSGDQMRGLQLHQIVTLYGHAAPPVEITRYVTPAPAVRPVPRGPADRHVIAGVVTAADPRGRVSIESAPGPLQVWAATGAEQRFRPGAKVRIDIIVQPVDLVPAGAGASPLPTAEAVAPPPAPAGQPGDSATVTGRIMGIGRNGILVVESPTGPVQVWVADSTKYRVEQPVQIRTHLSTAVP